MSSTPAAAKPAQTKPIVRRQFGNISVAVFAREVSRPDGTRFTAQDFVLQKSWKDKQGQWQDQSVSLQARELFAVQKALDAAFVESYDGRHDDEE